MEKSIYIIRYKPEYAALAGASSPPPLGPVVVSITQGGFGQDVIDAECQVKERFLEYLFETTDLDLSRSAEEFDRYFDLEPAEEFLDLDQDL